MLGRIGLALRARTSVHNVFYQPIFLELAGLLQSFHCYSALAVGSEEESGAFEAGVKWEMRCGLAGCEAVMLVYLYT